MTDTQGIRRRLDGSIDTGYYIDKGLSRRSAAAHGIAGQARRRIHGILAGLAALLSRLPALGGGARMRRADDAGPRGPQRTS